MDPVITDECGRTVDGSCGSCLVLRTQHAGYITELSWFIDCVIVNI
jgi:hypothetical protein